MVEQFNFIYKICYGLLFVVLDIHLYLVLLFENQLSREEYWDPIKRFNYAIFPLPGPEVHRYGLFVLSS